MNAILPDYGSTGKESKAFSNPQMFSYGNSEEQKGDNTIVEGICYPISSSECFTNLLRPTVATATKLDTYIFTMRHPEYVLFPLHIYIAVLQ